MLKKKLAFLLVIPVIACLSLQVFAHSGGTDSSGGHTDRSTGEYHYHHGYSAHDHKDMDGDGILDCPYDFKDKTNNSNSSDNRNNNNHSSTVISPNIDDLERIENITFPTIEFQKESLKAPKVETDKVPVSYQPIVRQDSTKDTKTFDTVFAILIVCAVVLVLVTSLLPYDVRSGCSTNFILLTILAIALFILV